MRNISFSMTERQFLYGTKSVTRRLGWRFLKPGDRLCVVRKGQGLKKGEKVVRLGVIEVIAAHREPLRWITPIDVTLEGFHGWTMDQFVDFFCKAKPPNPGIETLFFNNT